MKVKQPAFYYVAMEAVRVIALSIFGISLFKSTTI